jgi:hypothetical protein
MSLNTDFLLWSMTEQTPQASVNAALKVAENLNIKPTRILFNAGEMPAGLKVPAGISVEEGANVTHNHFQVWQL